MEPLFHNGGEAINNFAFCKLFQASRLRPHSICVEDAPRVHLSSFRLKGKYFNIFTENTNNIRVFDRTFLFSQKLRGFVKVNIVNSDLSKQKLIFKIFFVSTEKQGHTTVAIINETKVCGSRQNGKNYPGPMTSVP